MEREQRRQWRRNLQISGSPSPETQNQFDPETLLLHLQDLTLQDPLPHIPFQPIAANDYAAFHYTASNSAAASNVLPYDPWTFTFPGLESGSGSGLGLGYSLVAPHRQSELERLRILSPVRGHVVNPLGPWASESGSGLRSSSRNFTNGCELCAKMTFHDVLSKMGYCKCSHKCTINYDIRRNNLRGKVSSYAKDEYGSLAMTQNLVKLPIETIQLMVIEVKEDVKEIIKNPSGTNFFQALVHFFDDTDITHLLHVIMATQEDFLDLSLDVQATHSVQTIIQKIDINNEDQKSIVASVVRGVTVALSMDTAGHYVVEELMKTFYSTNDVMGPIMNELTNNCPEIALNKNGCCVLQKCGNYVQRETFHLLVLQVIYYTFQLSQQEYGNYVVQYVIEMENYYYTREIMERLWGRIGNLSRNKYGSHVVEKCLMFGTDEQAEGIIDELLGEADFLQIIQDGFGNFVAQAAIARAEKSQRLRSKLRSLERRIQSHHAALQNHPFGTKVLTRLRRAIRLTRI